MSPLAQGEPFSGGVTFAGTYRASGDPASSPYSYGRYHNPTWTQFECALSELEGGFALSFASGMAAVAAVFATVLRRGEIVAMPSDSYYTSRLLADSFLAEMGIRVRKSATINNTQMHDLDGAKLLWLETPTNPGLDVCDIAALADAAHRKKVLVAVDNTTCTLLGQSALDLGADFSVASDTKALTGHGDLILGHVAVRDSDWRNKLQSWRNLSGAVPGPMEVWLAHRSLATLEMRLTRQCHNAQLVANFLTTRAEIKGVRYPGLPNDPAYEIATRQMTLFGPIIGFTLPTCPHAERFLRGCKLVIEATSFGGVHSTAERRARWGGDLVDEGFIRLSVGCEDNQDIIDDLEQALDLAFSGNGSVLPSMGTEERGDHCG